jgi:hypothetical protein
MLLKVQPWLPNLETAMPLKKEKEALHCLCAKMMDVKLNRKDAAVIIKNFFKYNVVIS